MVFKQGILKEKLIIVSIALACALLPYVFILILIATKATDIEKGPLFLLFSVWFLPLYILCVLFEAFNLESFCIYNDRIEARNFLGIKNVVYFERVQRVEERGIKLTAKGTIKQFYVFQDGRKNTNFFKHDSCNNKRKLSFRIHKTAELEDFVVNQLGLEVIETEPISIWD